MCFSWNHATQQVLVRSLERAIRRVEGFDVDVYWPDWTNVRGDYRDAMRYERVKASPNNWTVDDWIRKRFKKFNPQFEVRVKDGNGDIVRNNTRLRTVRDTYPE